MTGVAPVNPACVGPLDSLCDGAGEVLGGTVGGVVGPVARGGSGLVLEALGDAFVDAADSVSLTGPNQLGAAHHFKIPAPRGEQLDVRCRNNPDLRGASNIALTCANVVLAGQRVVFWAVQLPLASGSRFKLAGCPPSQRRVSDGSARVVMAGVSPPVGGQRLRRHTAAPGRPHVGALGRAASEVSKALTCERVRAARSYPDLRKRGRAAECIRLESGSPERDRGFKSLRFRRFARAEQWVWPGRVLLPYPGRSRGPRWLSTTTQVAHIYPQNPSPSARGAPARRSVGPDAGPAVEVVVVHGIARRGGSGGRP